MATYKMKSRLWKVPLMDLSQGMVPKLEMRSYNQVNSSKTSVNLFREVKFEMMWSEIAEGRLRGRASLVHHLP